MIADIFQFANDFILDGKRYPISFELDLCPLLFLR